MSNYKILAITIAAALTVSLTACSEVGNDSSISPIVQTTSAETVTESAKAVPETVTESAKAVPETVTESAKAIPETASAASETPLAESNELDEETAELLRREFAKYIGEIDPSYARFDPANVRIDTYYGRYNGCEVFLPLYRLGYAAAIEYYYVAGYEIYFPCLDYDIYVHKENSFYELSEAYEKGYISGEDVFKIAEIQNGAPLEKTDPPQTEDIGSISRKDAKLRREEANEFRRKFIEFLGNTDPAYADIEPSNVKIEPYCITDNGWEAFQPLYKNGYDDAEFYFSIAGYEMYFPCLGYEIYVHKDGEFYELSEAYEKGYIGEADVAQIAEANHNRYFFAFADRE